MTARVRIKLAPELILHAIHAPENAEVIDAGRVKNDRYKTIELILQTDDIPDIPNYLGIPTIMPMITESDICECCGQPRKYSWEWNYRTG